MLRMVRPARALPLLGLALSTALALPGVAAAGGWWSFVHLEDRPLIVGERVEPARPTGVLFESIEAALRARDDLDRYYAYLIPGFDWRIVDEATAKEDPGDWWEPPDGPIRSGSVIVRETDGNYAMVEVVLDIPEIEPGGYALMLCDAGCLHPLGDIIPSQVAVTSDPRAARTERPVDEVRECLPTDPPLPTDAGSLSVDAGWFVAGAVAVLGLGTWRRRTHL